MSFWAGERPMLRELQAQFIRDALSDRVVEADYVLPGTLTAARRIEVYRTNVMANLTGALGDIYPVIKRLVGDAFFQHAAEQYVRATPSRSGDLNQFGDAWPQFLADYPYGQDHPYLPDVARLEWAWHRAFHAADADAFDLTRLAAVPPERHAELHFKLQPAMAIIDSRYPLSDIWRVNQLDHVGADEIDWQQRVHCTLVYRHDYAVLVRTLSLPERAFLAALQQGLSLGESIEPAFAVDAQFDLQGFLLWLVQYGVITDMESLA